MGELIITFLGPPPNEFLVRKALDILGTYLTSSAVAPLNKEYVEIESPLWYEFHLSKSAPTRRLFSQFLYLLCRGYPCHSR